MSLNLREIEDLVHQKKLQAFLFQSRVGVCDSVLRAAAEKQRSSAHGEGGTRNHPLSMGMLYIQIYSRNPAAACKPFWSRAALERRSKQAQRHQGDMVPARRLTSLFAAALAAAAAAVLNWSVAVTAVPLDTPAHPAGAWTTTSRRRAQGKGSFDGSHQRLEEQASQETRETFGEDFYQQLEAEQHTVRRDKQGRARISREAGCSPASPLSSPSLGDVEGPGKGDEQTRKGATEGGSAGPAIGDWLR